MFDGRNISTYAINLEPFDSGLFSHGSGSAYPPDRSRALYPVNLDFSWTDEGDDEFVFSPMKELAANMTSVANSEGQNVADATLYGNYALADTPVEQIYGASLPRLQEIKRTVDPNGVMDLTGGFKL